MKVVVLYGGDSPERAVSLESGLRVSNSLLKSNHDVALIDLYQDYKIDNELNYLFKNGQNKFEFNSPNVSIEILRSKKVNPENMIGENVLNICAMADIVFMALHGSIGENGQLQAILDSKNIKYTGTGYVGSLLAMDKDLTKTLLTNANVLTANWELIDLENLNSINLKFPFVMKPRDGGSSIGVHFIEDQQAFDNKVKELRSHERFMIIEEKLEGREFSVGVLDNKALPPIEIIASGGFYDYENKYIAGMAEEICPAELDKKITTKLQAITLKAHSILRLGSYSRIDFIIQGNDIFCLEANTLPGMTPTSLFPQEANAIGINFDELCNQMIHLSLK